MFRLIQTLAKVIVAKFYERNAGLLFFVFFLLFGVVESNQIINYHKALIYGTLTSLTFLLIVCGIWLLYLVKCLHFFLAKLTKLENTFLFELGKIRHAKRFWLVAILVFLLYEPVLIYSCFIIGIGIYSKLFTATAVVILFHLFGMASVSMLISYQLNRPHKQLKLINIPAIRWPWPKPFCFFYINQLTLQLPTVLLFSKLFSLLAIYGFFQIPLDHYDNRIALMGLLFGLAAHSVIVFEFRAFEERNLLFLRNLPIENWKRFINIALVYLLLLAPEFIVLLVNHLKVIDAIAIILFGAGALLLLHNRLYIQLNNDKHLQWVLGLFLVSFALVLFKIYLAEVMLLWICAFFLMNRYYYRFEK